MPLEVGQELWLQRDKWPDRPHYRHWALVLGKDECGWWVGAGPGNPIYRGDEVMFVAPEAGLMCIEERRPWTAWFPLPPRRFDVYCDVVTPLVLHAEGTLAVDLDLDVVRWGDGRVEVVDQDEFELHRTLYGYPDDVAAAALQAADEVAAVLRNGEPPFDAGRADRWAAELRART